MNWNNISLIVLGLSALAGAFFVALWVSLVIWSFRDMRARSRDAFAQLLAALMVLVLGPLGALLYLLLRPRETLAEKYERAIEEEALLQDIEDRNICPGCKQPIEPDYMLCPICQTRLRQPCVHCGRLIHPRWSVCPYCASSQKPVPGIEQAGRVTLLDLQKEEAQQAQVVQQPAAVPLPEEEEVYELAADNSWDRDPLASLMSTHDEPEAEPAIPEQDQPDTADTAADQERRRPLSLFKRS